MKPVVKQLAILAASLLIVACGGDHKKSTTAKLVEGVDDNVDIYAEMTGIDDSTPVEVEEDQQEKPVDAAAEAVPEGEGDYIGGTQGAFVATMLVAGQEVAGKVTVKTATNNPEIVRADVRVGEEISLDPGSYDFAFTTDTIAGSPEFTLRDVEIPQGRKITREVKIPTGQITLVTGQRCAKKSIRVRPKGASDWYKGKYFTCQPITLLAGEYEAELSGSKGGTPISGIQVYDGGKRDVMIRHQ